MSEDYLSQRARRASRESYDTALAEVPDVDPEPHDRLTEACAKLDPDEKRALAEEGLAADCDAWPTYADELREELERRTQEQAANPGVGRSWAEVKGRLLRPE